MAIVYFRLGALLPADPRRAALLEQLLARADGALHLESWRALAWRALAPGIEPPGIACGARIDGGATCDGGAARDGRAAHDGEAPPAGEAARAGGWVLLATPVHLIAGLHSVSLASNGLLALSMEESVRLAAEFKIAFAGSGARLVQGRGTQLLCMLDASAARTAQPPPTRDPETLLGRDIGAHLPQGAAGAPLRRLMSEIEMWLHDHPVNELRRARHAPEIGGLWLWGGARADERLPELDLWSHGEDPLFGGYTPLASYPSDAHSGDARSGDARSGATRSGIVVSDRVPGEEDFASFERDWLVPALKDLRAGRLERLELSLGESGYRLGRIASYRLWRRARPWWSELMREEST